MTVATPEFTALVGNIITKMILPVASKIIAKGEQHQPMVMLFDEDAHLREARLVVFNSDQDKDFAAALHRKQAARADVGCALLVTESWLMLGTGEQISRHLGDMEHAPGRGEGLVLSARKDDQHLYLVYRIVRPGEGKKGSRLADQPILIDAGDPKAMGVGRFFDNDDHPPTRH